MPPRLRGLPCVGSDMCICAFCQDGTGAGGAARPASSDSVDTCRGLPSGSSSAAPPRDRRSRRVTSSSRVGVPPLVDLCLEQLSLWLPELLEEGGEEEERQEGAVDASVQLSLFASLLPSSIKQTLAALARRQFLLSDALLLNGLLDASWTLLDVSHSLVSDATLHFAAAECPRLQAVDVRHCDEISATAIIELLTRCPQLQTLRLGGSPQSNAAAKRAVRGMLRGLLPQRQDENESATKEAPSLASTSPAAPSASSCRLTECGSSADTADVTGSSADASSSSNSGGGGWEDLAEEEQQPLVASSLKWLVWPEIDNRTLDKLTGCCPRIRVVGIVDAQLGTSRPVVLEPLDAPFVQNLSSARIWEGERAGSDATPLPQEGPKTTGRESIAEKFRLAYAERDQRLAPKRAKNARQRLRREALNAQHADEWTRARSLAAAVEKR